MNPSFESDRVEIESLRKRVAEMESLVDQVMWSLIEGDRILLQASANIQEHVAHGNELQARAERLQAALSQAYDALKYQLGADDWTPELNKRGIDALAAIAAALAGDTAKPEAKP